MLLTVIICAALIALDQGLKIWAVSAVKPVDVLPGLAPVFQFRYVENTGAAFSILEGKQVLLIVVTGIALLAVAAILLFRRPQNRLEYLALVMIFSGGVGNLIDRIAHGYVVDFIDLMFMRFAVFNFADMLVVVGFILLIFAVLRQELLLRREKKAEEAPADAVQGADDAPEG